VAEDNYATKEDLRILTKDVQILTKDLAAVEQRLTKDLAAVEQRLTHAIEQTVEVMRNIETSLLTAFHSYAKGNAARLLKIEASDMSADLRLNVLEDRVLALETRRSA
jgi:hypothetical protein